MSVLKEFPKKIIRPYLAAIIFLVVCLLPFIPGLTGPFLFDDSDNINAVHVPRAHWQDIYEVFFSHASGLVHRPISNLSFAANKALWGTNPFHFKLVNLLLHGLIAFGLWALAVRILRLLYPTLETRRIQIISLLAAVLWAIHPLQVSTVLYVVQRMTQLSTLFVVLALLAALHFLQRTKKPISLYAGMWASVTTWGLVLLAFFSKENGLLFPAFILALFMAAPSASRMLFTASSGKKVFFALNGWLPALLAAGAIAWLWATLTADFAGRDFTLTQRILTEPFVLAHYARNILIPNINQMGLYLDDTPIHGPNEVWAWLMLITTLALPILVITLRRYSPILCLAVLWFYAAHLMESTFLPLELAFEHRNYLALFGPMLAVAYGLTKPSDTVQPTARKIIIGLIVLVLGIATFARAHQWSRQDLFIQSELQNHLKSPRAQSQAIEFDLAHGNIVSALIGTTALKNLRPHSFWPYVYDIHLACDIPNYRLNWEHMLRLIAARPQEAWTYSMLRIVTLRFSNNTCAHLSPIAYDQFLGRIVTLLSSNHNAAQAEKTLVLRAYMAQARKDNTRAKQYLMQAADLNTGGDSIALFDLAYLQLNTGDLNGVEQTIARLRRSGDRTGSYRIDEIEGYLKDAQTKLASNPSSKITESPR